MINFVDTATEGQYRSVTALKVDESRRLRRCDINVLGFLASHVIPSSAVAN